MAHIRFQKGRVLRGGRTAPGLVLENNDLRASVSRRGQDEYIAFEGGITELSLQVPIIELGSLIDLIGDQDGSEFSSDLARCAISELVRKRTARFQ